MMASPWHDIRGWLDAQHAVDWTLIAFGQWRHIMPPGPWARRLNRLTTDFSFVGNFLLKQKIISSVRTALYKTGMAHDVSAHAWSFRTSEWIENLCCIVLLRYWIKAGDGREHIRSKWTTPILHFSSFSFSCLSVRTNSLPTSIYLLVLHPIFSQIRSLWT